METKRQQLETLLNERLDDCRSREKTAFDHLIEGSSGLVLFGAGGLGKKALQILRGDGIEPLGFVDNRLAGSTVEGLPVLSRMDAAKRWGPSACFIVTIWASWADSMLEQIKSLKDLGCATVIPFIPLLWKHPEQLPHVQVDLPSRVLEQRDSVLRAFDLMCDEYSRREYLAQLRWRLLADFESLGPPVADPYWQRNLVRLGQNSVFADVGAFDGDTLDQFISYVGGQFRRAYVFEPDTANIAAIQKRLDQMDVSLRSKIKVFQVAVAEREYDVAFSAGGGESSHAGSGSGTVRCVSLDGVLEEPPDFVKFDIEGFELLGLQGAGRLIARYCPLLAVCLYHTQNHLWEIPLLIHSINPRYKYYIRPHGQIWETVCYAIPANPSV